MPRTLGVFLALLGSIGLLQGENAPTVAGEKETRTAAMQKMDSQLVLAVRKNKGEALPEGVQPAVKTDAAGRVIVDVTSDVTPEVLGSIERMGGAVLSQFPGQRALRAAVPVSGLERLASEPAVRFIRPAVPALREGARSGPSPKP